MGWGRMMLLGNWGQQMDIDDLEGNIAQLRGELAGLHGWGTENAKVDQKQSDQIGALQRENDELKVCVATLARMLVQKGVLTQEELTRIASALDA